jgi:hypothetical protein
VVHQHDAGLGGFGRSAEYGLNIPANLGRKCSAHGHPFAQVNALHAMKVADRHATISEYPRTPLRAVSARNPYAGRKPPKNAVPPSARDGTLYLGQRLHKLVVFSQVKLDPFAACSISRANATGDIAFQYPAGLSTKR